MQLWKIRVSNEWTEYVVLEGQPRLVREACKDCKLEMDEIRFEELEEENERLKDEEEDEEDVEDEAAEAEIELEVTRFNYAMIKQQYYGLQLMKSAKNLGL